MENNPPLSYIDDQRQAAACTTLAEVARFEARAAEAEQLAASSIAAANAAADAATAAAAEASAASETADATAEAAEATARAAEDTAEAAADAAEAADGVAAAANIRALSVFNAAGASQARARALVLIARPPVRRPALAAPSDGSPGCARPLGRQHEDDSVAVPVPKKSK
ncbi:unnamed protein product [Penicillium bialowiezense]